MSNRMKKLVSLLAVAVMAVSVFAGCGNTDDKESSSTPESSSSSVVEESSSSVEESSEEVKEFTYPYEPTTTLTINFSNYLFGSPTDGGPARGDEAFEELTGVQLESNGVWKSGDDYLLMLISGKLPDILNNNINTNYVGGPSAAIEEGYIIDLSPYTDWMPNYMKVLEENPVIKEQMVTEKGEIWGFAEIMSGLGGDSSPAAITIRKDVLDDLGLKVPRTVDEFYNVLKTVKEKTDMTPLAFEMRWLWNVGMMSAVSNAFDTGICSYYTADGGKTVENCFTWDGTKEFLQTMNKWYAEGLIDKDLASLVKGDVRGDLANGTLFAAIQGHNYSAEAATANETSNAVPGMELYLLDPLVDEDGVYVGWNKNITEDNRDGYKSIGCVFSVTTSCAPEKLEAAIRYLDFMYTEDAPHILNNGPKGYTWDYDANGEVYLTDFMLKNPDGKSASELKGAWAKGGGWAGITGVDDLLYWSDWERGEVIRRKELDWNKPENVTAVKADCVTLTEEEQSKLTELKDAGFQTYMEEKIAALVIGNESFDNWNDIVNTAKTTYKLDEICDLYESAWARVAEESK